MSIAEIVIANTARATDKTFHYSVPDGMALSAGMRVLVPFGAGNRTTEGIVVGFAEQSAYGSLKAVMKILDERPLLNGAMLSLAKWMREKYLCTFYQALKTVMPSGISVKTTEWITVLDGTAVPKSASERAVLERIKDAGGTADFGTVSDLPGARRAVNALNARGIVSRDEETAQSVKAKQIRMVSIGGETDVEALYKKAPKQAKMLEILRQTGAISAADLVAFSGGSYGAVNALRDKGLVIFEDRTVLRTAYRGDGFAKTVPLPPTAEQEKVLRYLNAAFDAGETTPVLLRGVTGSGKTEVFLQMIEHILQAGKHAIVLVPEISLTPQMVERFVGRFGDFVSVLHSGMSLGERYDEWTRIASGSVKVAVGARSAVFAPFARLGVIIIDEEHEGTYKSESVPYYHAREIALKRSENEGAMVVMSSATPAVTSYYKAVTGGYRLFEMLNRHNLSAMPRVVITDMRTELQRGNKSVFSERLRCELEKNIAAGQQTILFHNRRGFNSFVLCRTCGEALLCDHCSVTLTYHKHSGRLKCHYCGFERQNVTVCPSCGSPHIRFMGTGTEKIEEEIIRLFGGKQFIRMDGDTTSGKNSHELILRRFARENIPILLGTQMVTKGLDFPNVTLVGVMMADLSLNTDDYRAAERTFSQLTQVCGRAGRGDLSGRAVVQTYQPEHYAVQLAKSHDYTAFYNHEIAIRRELVFPPFCDVVVIMMQGENAAGIVRELTRIADGLRGRGAALLGPVSAPYAKIKNKYRWRIILKCADARTFAPLLHNIMVEYAKSENQLTIDVNPNSMN